MRRNFFPVIGILGLALFIQAAENTGSLSSTREDRLKWVESSFEDLVDGSFSDAGANMYVSSRGRMASSKTQGPL